MDARNLLPQVFVITVHADSRGKDVTSPVV